MQIRELADADADASLRMSRDAFGGPLADRPTYSVGGGVTRWGLFDGGRLAAKAVSRDYRSMIGGREVSTAGVAGVAVAPEYRGRGLARQVMTHALSAVRDSGAAISTLFRTTPALYRSLGYEQVAELVDGELPASALAGLRPDPQVRLRRAGPADGPAIRAVYAALAAEGSCLLTRSGPAFTATDEQLIDAFDGITLAEVGGTVVGYASWHRGEGFGTGAALSVSDLLALSRDALEALIAMLGSFGSVTPTIRLRTSGDDPLHWAVPGAGWTVTEVRPYLLRVVDVAAAVQQRGWPRAVAAAVDLEVVDPVCPWNTGRHRLVVADGEGRVERGSGVGPRISPQGLVLLVAGGFSTSGLRRAGMLDGGSPDDLATLDALMAGPQPAILDFF